MKEQMNREAREQTYGSVGEDSKSAANKENNQKSETSPARWWESGWFEQWEGAARRL